MGETRIPPDAIRKMVGSTLQMIVQCSRYHDGGRRTSHISEVLGVDEHGVMWCEIYFAGCKQERIRKRVNLSER